MSVEKLHNDRWVMDPAFSPVKAFLKERLEIVTKEGDLVDRLLGDYRYEDMKGENFAISSPAEMGTGEQMVSFTRRNKDYARVDVPLVKQRLMQVFKDHGISYKVGIFKDLYLKGEALNALVYDTVRDTFIITLPEAQLQDLGAISTILQVFIRKLTMDRWDTIGTVDNQALMSGEVRIDDPSISDEFIYFASREAIEDELDLTKLKAPWPEAFSGRRGDKSVFLGAFTVGGFVIPPENITVGVNSMDLAYGKDPGWSGKGHQFFFVNGDKTNDKEVTVTAIVKYKEGPIDIDKTYVSKVTILKDNVNNFTVTGIPIQSNFPVDNIMGVHPVVKVGDDVIPTSSITLSITSLMSTLPAFKRTIQGTEGMWFTERTVVFWHLFDASDAIVFNIEFKHNNVQYKGKVVSSIKYDYENTGPFNLNLLSTIPGSLTLKDGETQGMTFNYQYEGVTVPSKDLFVNMGAYPGSPIAIDSLVGDKFQMRATRDSGVPGTALTGEMSPSGKYWDGDKLHPFNLVGHFNYTVNKDSTVTVKEITSVPIKVSRYGHGVNPFEVVVNGNVTTNFKAVRIQDDSGVIKKSIITQGNSDWQALGNPGEGIATNVVYHFDLEIDGETKTFSGVKRFEINGYSGGGYASIPGNIIIAEKIGTTITAEVVIYKGETFAPQGLVFDLAGSDIPTTMKVLDESTPSQGKYNILLAGDEVGLQHATLTFSETPVWTSETGIKIPLEFNVKPAEKLLFTSDSLVNVRPGENGKINCDLYYDGREVPLTDSRVTLKLLPKTEINESITLGQVVADGVLFNNQSNPAFGHTDINEMDLELVFMDETSTPQIRHRGVDIVVSRPAEMTCAFTIVTNPIKPNIIDQVIVLKLTDDSGFSVNFAVLESILIMGVQPFIGPVSGYRNELKDIGNGLYEVRFSTNAFGGAFKIQLKVTLGGKVFDVEPLNYIDVNEAPMKTVTETNLRGILNVTTDVSFTVNQDRPGENNKPIVFSRTSDVVTDPEFIKNPGPIVPSPTVPGSASISLTSTGKKGETKVTFTGYTQEGPVEKKWEGIEFTISSI